jgi:phage-related minor tail protein
MASGLWNSKAWANTVAAAALVYGVVGVFALGVAIDAVLLAGAIVLGGNPVFGVWRMDACRNTILP